MDQPSRSALHFSADNFRQGSRQNRSSQDQTVSAQPQLLPFSTEHFIRDGPRHNRSSREDPTVSTPDGIVDLRSQHLRLGSSGHIFMVAAFAAKQDPKQIKMTISEVTSGDGIWKLVIEGDSLHSIFDLYSSITPSQEEKNLQLGPILDWFIRQVRIEERNGHSHFFLAGLNYQFSASAPQRIPLHEGQSQSQKQSSRTPHRASLHEGPSQSQQLSSRMSAVDSSPFTTGIMGL
jgi:hypothetical protein